MARTCAAISSIGANQTLPFACIYSMRPRIARARAKRPDRNGCQTPTHSPPNSPAPSNAARLAAGHLHNDLAGAPQPVSFLFRRHGVRMLVQIPVMRDLMTTTEDRLHRLRITLHAPGREEEGLAHAEAAVDLDDARDRDL